MIIAANYFAPTEAQRRALDRLWKEYNRLASRSPSPRDLTARGRADLAALLRVRRQIEDTIAANMNGFSSAEEARSA